MKYAEEPKFNKNDKIGGQKNDITGNHLTVTVRGPQGPYREIEKEMEDYEPVDEDFEIDDHDQIEETVGKPVPLYGQVDYYK